MSSLVYWVWLSSRPELGSRDRFRLLEELGSPEEVYYADPADLTDLGLSEAARAALADRSLDEADRILAACDRLDSRILTLRDAEYPDRLRQLYDPPLLLYTKGRIPRFDSEAVIAVVGSRAPSAYGLQCARTLGYQLAAQGALVLSGMARGIDSAAVTAALQAGGTTVGVLGGGLDVIYPPENRRLYEDVAAAGCLLSEYPPGTRPLAFHFPLRNRLMSGLSVGVLVVEAAQRSGTLITARHALEQGRDVYALPGNIDAPNAAGTNRLIRDGEAELVTCARDILEPYVARFPGKLRPLPVPALDVVNNRETAPAEPAVALEPAVEEPTPEPTAEALPVIPAANQKSQFSDDEMAILRFLADGARQVDAIIAGTDIPARRALSALTVLELRGMLRQQEGKYFEALIRLE